MILSICASAPVGAADSNYPHRFYGNVTINGNPAPVGTHITAIVTGGGSEDYTTTVSGVYGNAGITGSIPSVLTSDGVSTIESGAPITFSINGTCRRSV